LVYDKTFALAAKAQCAVQTKPATPKACHNKAQGGSCHPGNATAQFSNTPKALHTLLSTKDRRTIMQMRFVFGQHR